MTDLRGGPAAVPASESLLRLFLTHSPAAVAMLDCEMRYLVVSPRWLEEMGHVESEVIGRSHYDLFPDLPDQMREAHRRALDGAREVEEEFREEAEGSVRWYRREVRPWHDHDGRVGGILILTDDITERKLAEEALRESEARFRHVVDNAPVMVWIDDADARCTWVNKPWLDFVGNSADQQHGDGWLAHTHPDDRDRCAAAYGTAFGHRRPFTLDYRLRRHDGVYRWVVGKGVPAWSGKGAFVGYIGSCMDITERKEAEDALREGARLKDEFLATLAHELRNPLAPIRYSLYSLRLDITEESAAARTLDVLDRQVGHMDRLVDDLIDVSRITRGKIGLRPERVELAMVLQTALEASRAEVEARGHKLVIGIPREPLPLQADPVRLAQVFGNLVHNAAKYTRDGGLIGLEVVKGEREVTVIVRDSGIGISAELLPRVFDLFAQGDRMAPRTGASGLGIGLTLVKRLVEMHNGRVEARSPGPGHGSEFRVTLPLAAGPSRGVDVPVPSGLRRGRLNGRRVVVVDDNRDSADSLGVLLASLGAETRVAYDGRTALEAVQATQPAVVLLDLGMPGIDGYEVARRIRTLPGGDTMLVVAVTGWGHAEARRKSREAGFDYHLVKPVGFDVLQSILMATDLPTDRGAAPANRRGEGPRPGEAR